MTATEPAPCPPDLAPGLYRLVSGLYDPETWRRLRATAGGDRLVIAEIDLQALSH